MEALQQELGHPILVKFKKCGDLQYLDEISTLYDLNSKRNWAVRYQQYDNNKYFHLEDFHRVLKGTRLIDASVKLMSLRVGMWGRRKLIF